MIALGAESAESPLASVSLAGSSFIHETFSTAPVDWRVAGNALAEVTNRWQCDPRWTFVSLENDLRKKDRGAAAALWSKRLYPSNVAINAFVCEKMEQRCDGPYKYARDINVTICSDGSDLTKGYTFMFGGRNNTGTMILRNGVEVARSTAKIPTDMSIHHDWFSIRVEKLGKRVSFSVIRYHEGRADNKKIELAYDDAEPLNGDHVALWTYDNAVMLSRIDISGKGGTALDDPDWQPGPLKNIYDKEK